ncbi:MAG: hypothetical protein LBR83_04720 [Clostridiales bacterium]|jgi:membrane-bound serine protease (ClpP class)|nr:hypothetical protein [Clostridiales bacterium]
MVTLCIVLLVIGLLCLIAEMFVMGFGACGTAGIAALTVSAVLAVLYVPFGWFIVAAEVAVLAGFMYFLFVYMKKRKLDGKLIMKETLNEDVLPVSYDTFIGKEGVANTPLRPVGEVDFNGVPVEASSSGAFIAKGVRVKVVDVQSNKIIVSETGNKN